MKEEKNLSEDLQVREDLLMDAEREIRAECRALEEMLLEKNRRYGNSALDPIRLFSRSDAIEGLRVRIDDKLSRLVRGAEGDEDEDLLRDLPGYLILLRIAKRLKAEKSSCQRCRHSWFGGVFWYCDRDGERAGLEGDQAALMEWEESHKKEATDSCIHWFGKD